jgi:tetratricopeptide (TPR) repeat protein
MDRFDWLELERVSGSGKADAAPLAEEPDDGPSFYRAARLMRQAGHFKAAAELYERAIGYQAHLHNARLELIDTLVRAGQLDWADRASKEAIETYKIARVFYAARALVQAHRGDIRDAYALSQVSLEGEESLWYSDLVRGEILLRVSADNRLEAVQQFETACDEAPGAWEPYFLAGWALQDAKLAVLAAGYFAEAAHRNPRAPICWLCLGDCFQELRLYDQALFYYRRVTDLDPNHELGLARQKKCGGLIYGLMRVFSCGSMEKRWQREFDKL